LRLGPFAFLTWTHGSQITEHHSAKVDSSVIADPPIPGE
jgi:hypothetical protein